MDSSPNGTHAGEKEAKKATPFPWRRAVLAYGDAIDTLTDGDATQRDALDTIRNTALRSLVPKTKLPDVVKDRQGLGALIMEYLREAIPNLPEQEVAHCRSILRNLLQLPPGISEKKPDAAAGSM